MTDSSIIRLWTGLAIAAAASAASAQTIVTTHPQTHQGLTWQTQGEGEGGGGAAEEIADSTPAYLAALDYMLGHLTVGAALYLDGLSDHALTHMKHPGDEIYSDLLPAFAARSQPGFEAELATLAGLVEGGASPVEVEAALAALRTAIDTARGAPTPREEMDAIVRLVRTAADEYAIGVVDGKLANLHEYQDAWGFLQVASARLNVLAGSQDAAVAAAATEALAALSPTEANFAGGLLAEGGLTGADAIFGAAARIELAALTLQ
jgi:hypothetical protein